MRPQPSYFAVLALLIGLVAVWDNTTRANFPARAGGGCGPAHALDLRLARARTHPAQSGLPGPGASRPGSSTRWITALSPPWWKPALMIAISLGLSHWWQTQKVLALRSQVGLVWQGLYALAIIGVLYRWLEPENDFAGLAGGDEPAGGRHYGLRSLHPGLAAGSLRPDLPAGKLRPVRAAACPGQAALAAAAGAHRRPGAAVVLHRQMVPAQAG